MPVRLVNSPILPNHWQLTGARDKAVGRAGRPGFNGGSLIPNRRHLRGRHDLPEIAIRVAEVPTVSTPGGGSCLHDAATGCHGVAHDLVHHLPRRDDVVE